MGEIFRPVKDYPNYEVSEFGDIRSLMYNGKLRSEPKLLKRHLNTKGYRYVTLSKNGIPKTKTVHRIVIEAWGPDNIDNKPYVAHNDGDKLNNHISNLRWATPDENASDRDLHGTTAVGEVHGRSLFTREQALEIVREYKWTSSAKSNAKELAEKYGVHFSVITSVVSGRNWKGLFKEILLERDQLQSDLTRHKEMLKEANKRIEELDSPYCAVCGSCGEDGCCPAQKCQYPGIKEETLTDIKALAEEVCTENKDLKSKLEIAREALKFYCWPRLYIHPTSGEFYEMKMLAGANVLSDANTDMQLWGTEANKALKEMAGTTKLGTGHYMIDNPFDNANVKCEAGEENAK